MPEGFEFELEINIQTSNRYNYRRFIETMRARLTARFSHNLPVLPRQEETPTRFFDLVIRTSNHSVRFRLRMDNLYLIGYQMENEQWLEFGNKKPKENAGKSKKNAGKAKKNAGKSNESAPVHLITEKGTTFLGFKGTYRALGEVSGCGEQLATGVGRDALVSGINELAISTDRETRARHLIVVIMMFCEAARLIPVFEYVADHFTVDAQIQPWMRSIVGRWGNCSEFLLRADANPNEPFQLARQSYAVLPDGREDRYRSVIEEIIAILLGDPPSPSPQPWSRRPLMASEEGLPLVQGLPLLQVFSVRIDNIDAENPGELYGTITVDDGIYVEYLYNRTRSNPQSIRPGQNALLIGPSQSILAIDNFTIKLLLTDKDTFSWDDEIVNKDISWCGYEFGNTYDEPIFEKLDGTNGSVTVNYAVLRDAVAARITITLEQGGEYTTNVYGDVSARYGNWNDDPNTTCLLFNRSRDDYVDVRRWGYIPLLRSVVAVPLDGSLIVTASLKDNDTFSGDDDIAIGTVEFPAQMSDTSFKQIKADGNGNWVTVTVYWSCQI